ncbi:dynein regulatory complex protein 11 [Chanos chanos]|uniref:Dynein regulatory complex protein 11 n=1 Tax=Chanos chanos TaxID=29144 RepID=A0A6J2W8L6_CHACN|nr:dynein regulatory complex protein 11-like [Chanos chanos]
MSHSTYNRIWSDAQARLSSLLREEAEPLRPEKDRVVFFQRLANLYVRYIQVFRELVEAHDQIVHPQKRQIIREVLDGVMGRVLELKNEMVEKEYSEYHYMDDVLIDLKLTPDFLEIPIPRYFIRERHKVLEDREKQLSSILESMHVMKTPKPVRTKNLEESVKQIQISERARQGRLRAKFMREIQHQEEWQRKTKDRDLSAVKIQKVWRGYIQRKKTKRERQEEMIFLGMAMDPSQSQPCPSVLAAQANEARRRTIQDEHEEDYQKDIITITEKLREEEGPAMRDTMKYQILQWFTECRDATGAFPDFPEEEDGGSALIFADKTPQQLMEELAAKEEDEANKKPKEKEEKKDKGKKDKGKGDEEVEEAGLKMLPSAFLADLEIGLKTYVEIWQNRNESKNFGQKHEAELTKEERRKQIEVEIRRQVDEMIRQELANLKLALDKEKGGKATGKATKKKEKGGEKKKKEKDLTADRTIESLYQELVEQGLLKPADNVKLQDYLGEYNLLGTTLRQTDIEPMPSLSDVRQAIALYAVLPLGSQTVHEKAPLVKSILLAGPSGVGKKMLVHAICQETGANLFDLSPYNVAGKYPGKKGLQMMVHNVCKVARLMQPSVIWIGDAEKMFFKKVPKEDKELDPRRLQKDLPEIVKSIKSGDRILVVGTTREPFNADLKALCKVYNKIILVPRPDYGSRYVMWKQLIVKYGGRISDALNISALAKSSDGYTPGHMVKVVQSILTEQRKQQLDRRPLTAYDFVEPLAKIDPVFQDEEEALKNWYAKTPLGKKRAKAASGKEGEEEAPKKGGKDAKKKGKK